MKELVPSDKLNLAIQDWLITKSLCTRRAYGRDLQQFCAWLNVSTMPEAIRQLTEGSIHEARHNVLQYREYLKQKNLAPETVNRALSAVKSLFQLLFDTGLIGWTLDVKGLKTESYKNIKGPTVEEVIAIIKAIKLHPDPVHVARDLALFRTLYALALRRNELVELDIKHFIDGELYVLGKGRDARTPLAVPNNILCSLNVWIEVHPLPDKDMPLFVNLARNVKGIERLTVNGLEYLLAEWCRKAGVRCYRPHKIRHAAINRALELTGGDVRKVRQYSRHKRVETVLIYAEKLEGVVKEIAEKVSI